MAWTFACGRWQPGAGPGRRISGSARTRAARLHLLLGSGRRQPRTRDFGGNRFRRAREQDADEVPPGRVRHHAEPRRARRRLERQLRPLRRIRCEPRRTIMNATTKQTIDDDRVLTVTRIFDAPRVKVWAAWIDFNHATHFDGPPGHPMKSMRSDLRVGGQWRNVMRYEGKELPQGGVYREIKKPEVLSFTFAWETDVG